MSSASSAFSNSNAEKKPDTDIAGDSVMRVENGHKVWRNSKREKHRTDGPAVITANAEKEWWVNDKIHRLDGPAAEWPDGSKFWYVNGDLHRTDGPAIERGNGTKEWFVRGKRHRLDGPAVESADGTKAWWISNWKIAEDDFNAFTKVRQRRLEKARHQIHLKTLDQLVAKSRCGNGGPA